MNKCPFCANQEIVLASNQHAYAILDKSPISRGHSLVISRRHAPTIFDLPKSDYAGCFRLAREVKELLLRQDEVAGLNLVVNCGHAAGQRVAHAHIHIVPRFGGKRVPQSVGLWSRIAQ